MLSQFLFILEFPMCSPFREVSHSCSPGAWVDVLFSTTTAPSEKQETTTKTYTICYRIRARYRMCVTTRFKSSGRLTSHMGNRRAPAATAVYHRDDAHFIENFTTTNTGVVSDQSNRAPRGKVSNQLWTMKTLC